MFCSHVVVVVKRKEESKMKMKRKGRNDERTAKRKGLRLEGTAHGCWISDVAVSNCVCLLPRAGII